MDIIDYCVAYSNSKQTNFTEDIVFEKTLVQNGSSEYSKVSEVVSSIFKSISSVEADFITNHVVIYINFLALKIGTDFDNQHEKDALWYQFIQNDSRDIKAIIQCMLPYIDDDSGKKRTGLKTMGTIYTEKDDDGNYVYTNSQYNRCIRISDCGKHGYSRFTDRFGIKGKKSGKNYIERKYSPNYFNDNFDLLLMTTDMVSNKLYVNWVDVVPIRMDQYQSTNLYKRTVEKLNGSVPKLYKQYIDINEGLGMCDIYDTMANHLFGDAKEHKWLMYDILSDREPITYLDYFRMRLNMTSIEEGISWLKISESERVSFRSGWSRMFGSGLVDEQTIVGIIHIFFSRFHKNRDALVRDKLLIVSGIDYDTLDENELRGMRYDDAKKGLLKVSPEEIYLFFCDQLRGFKKTWYYYFTKIKGNVYLGQLDHPVYGSIRITPKNVFNFCQSLCSARIRFEGAKKDDNGYPDLPLHWYSLPYFFRNMVTNRLFNVSGDVGEWFTINNYYRRFYRNVSSDDFPSINQMMYDAIKQRIPEIIFESLIYNGLLSHFSPQMSITDNNYIDAMGVKEERDVFAYKQARLSELVLSDTMRPLYEKHAYYYLTRQSYGDMDKHGVFSRDRKTKESYFNYICNTDQSWTFIYAMDWISQINFYHRYANTRVMYVTGAPGIGKSSQVPKLLIYAQRIIDYNTKGKIACTVPRINVLEKNSKSISTELGVPIYDSKPTQNYYMQYKYSKGSHLNQDYDSFVRIVTDGSLLQEIKQSPFLTKESKPDKFTNVHGDPVDWMKSYSSKNIYDTVIVDEAHEHNYNMDLIITLMRDAIYINNSVKLVIISATMDDDDPIYRRYFRNINDNRAYPLNTFISSNIIDRCNVDRRVHISPPGLTSRFEVIDHYLSENESDAIDQTNYVEKAVEITVKIVLSTNTQDILLFMPGSKQIRESITQINKMTPQNVIALPFHSKLSEEERDFINVIDRNLSQYDVHKDDVMEKTNQRKVKKGTYTRVIIVATNIAEASITIRTLGYVVDTGYSKVKTYDPVTEISKTIITTISNTSSLQRRGRVGRTASGHFYPLYSKRKLANNKTLYKIADEDVTPIITDLLKTDINDMPIIFDSGGINNNINNIKRMTAYFSELPINKENVIDAEFPFAYPYVDIIVDKYCHIKSRAIDSSLYFYSYFGVFGTSLTECESVDKFCDENYDDYVETTDYVPTRCYTGYDFATLEDRTLDFYVVHPEETIIRRNMHTGSFQSINVVGSIPDTYWDVFFKINAYPTHDIASMIEYIATHPFFVSPKIYLIKEKSMANAIFINISEDDVDNRIYRNNKGSMSLVMDDGIFSMIKANAYSHVSKTRLYDDMMEVKTLLDIDVVDEYENLAWYVYSMANGTDDDVLAMICMIKAGEGIDKWAKDVRKTADVPDLHRFIGLYKNYFGDVYALMIILGKFKSYIRDSGMGMNVDFDVQTRRSFESSKKDYLLNGIDDDNATMENLYRLDRLGTKDEFYEYVKRMKPPKLQIQDKLATFSKLNLINEKTFDSFFSMYHSTQFSIKKNRWIHEYELKHGMRETNADILTNLISKLNFPRIIGNSHVNRMYETYLRSRSSHLLIRNYEEGRYYTINGRMGFTTEAWNERSSSVEKTLLDKRHGFVVYDKISEDALGKTNLNYMSMTRLEWMMEMNPFYYYYILFVSNDAMDKENKDLLMQYFNKEALIRYIGQINDPSVTKAVNRFLAKKN